jgi:EAL domain-containing protein (putative c-di-GMP-specific phosphodiesterase class I)
LRLAVNVSARQISQHDFSENLKIILQETGLDPKALELEITESVLIQNADKSEKILESVAELGVSIALDDFGTGYSSLAYLKRFPIHTLKIDRNFVKGLPDKRDDVAIIDAILALARSLGIKVVAEGVETEEQHAFLRDHHCHQMQGFLFARPMPSEELDRWLVANRSGRTPHAHLPRHKP